MKHDTQTFSSHEEYNDKVELSTTGLWLWYVFVMN